MKKTKKIIPWVFSLFMFLCFILLKPFGISNLLFLSSGLSIIPPLVKWINKRKKYGEKLKWCVFIILFIFSIFTYQGNLNQDSKSNQNTVNYISQSEEQAKQQEEEKRQAEEQTKQQEEERRQAEEQAKQQEEEERRRAEEQAKQQEEERQQAEEQAKQQEKENQQSSINSNENKNKSRTVYITPSGKRYHYSSACAGKNARATTKDQAKLQGFTPCEKCAK